MGSSLRLGLLALTLTACGGAGAGAAPPPPAEPPAQPSPDVTPDATVGGKPEEATVDQAALAFERAEDQLDDLLAVADVGAQRLEDDAGPEGEKQPLGPTPAPSPAQPPPTKPRDLEQSARLDAATACSRACRALESMTRSSDRLCTLTGEDDPRCENVRERLDRAREAVRRSCRDCAE